MRVLVDENTLLFTRAKDIVHNRISKFDPRELQARFDVTEVENGMILIEWND